MDLEPIGTLSAVQSKKAVSAYFTSKQIHIIRGRILVQVTIYRRLPIGRDYHHDQSEAYDIS